MGRAPPIRARRGGTLTLGESEALVMFLALFALYSPPSCCKT